MKYKINLLLIVFVLSCLMVSCPPPEEISEKSPWTFENVRYGANRNQTFNIIMPKEKNNVHAVVYIHGGFYYYGNKLWYPLFLKDLSKKNIFVTMDYRLLTNYNNTVHMDDMIDDVDNALKKIKDLAEENGYSINDFILAGHSAGAHIGLLYGYKYFQENNTRPIKIAVCVSLSGPTDYTDDIGWSSMTYYGSTMERRLTVLSRMGTELTGHEIKLTQSNWTEQEDWSEYETYAKEISPVTYVSNTDKIPPTLLVHGEKDIIVPHSNSVRLNEALDNTSVEHKLITVTGTGNNHMLGGEPNTTDSVKPITYKNQVWPNEVKEWLETYLR